MSLGCQSVKSRSGRRTRGWIDGWMGEWIDNYTDSLTAKSASAASTSAMRETATLRMMKIHTGEPKCRCYQRLNVRAVGTGDGDGRG